ncbi:MAG: epimerase, partial [Solirubrobacterales bacterium]
TAEEVARLPFVPPELPGRKSFRTLVGRDTPRAREQLGWSPDYDARETLAEVVRGARGDGLLPDA